MGKCLVYGSKRAHGKHTLIEGPGSYSRHSRKGPRSLRESRWVRIVPMGPCPAHRSTAHQSWRELRGRLVYRSHLPERETEKWKKREY